MVPKDVFHSTNSLNLREGMARLQKAQTKILGVKLTVK